MEASLASQMGTKVSRELSTKLLAVGAGLLPVGVRYCQHRPAERPEDIQEEIGQVVVVGPGMKWI
jgi:hypothetical protein